MVPTVTGKQRALGIEHGYLGGRDPMQRWRRRAACCAALAAVACAVVAYLPFGPRNMVFTHGPISHEHAYIEAQCSKCHHGFAALQAVFSRRDDSRPELNRWFREGDKKCKQCHVDIREHNAHEKPHDVESCGSCHVEHQGKHVSLVRMDDVHCTRCHEDLAAHTQPEPKHEFLDVTRFDLDHPNFYSLDTSRNGRIRPDPGTVKFNHKLHLSRGLRRDPDGKNVMRWNDVSNCDDMGRLKRLHVQERNAMPGENDGTEINQLRDDGEVQLHCAACHQLDEVRTTDLNEAPSAAVDVVLSSGRYMAPMKYDRACKACHPLTIDPGGDDEVQHGLSPAQIRGQLLTHFEHLYECGPEALAGPLRRPPLPNEPAEPSSPVISSREDREKLVFAKMDAAERHLRRVCAKCHVFRSNGDHMAGYSLTEVEPARIPKVWLQHASFDHRAHQRIHGIDCVRCHRQANSAEDSAALMIPDRKICLECHSATPYEPSEQARYDCTECHRYHART